MRILLTALIALPLLGQTSARSHSALGKIREVGSMIPEAVVGENGEAAVIAFDDEIRVLQDFTRSPDAISDAFGKLKGTGEATTQRRNCLWHALLELSHTIYH